MTLTRRPRLALFAALAVLMAATRLNHFGAVPDASWAVFLLAGFYLAGSVRWAFPALMVLAVAVDYVVITGSGLSFWSHYCVSPGYWCLLPAHFALWAAGTGLARFGQGQPLRQLAGLAPAVLGGVALCHLFAQGGFYWLSSSVAAPTVAGWAKNYADWFLPYLGTTALYVGLAVVVHALVLPMLRAAPVAAGDAGR
ncbi:MAG: hypothetical protein K0M64_00210 [Rhizobium sp.]|nr:hypothetical protein [Rhizobium sp.]